MIGAASEGQTALHPDFLQAVIMGNGELPQLHVAQTILLGHAAMRLVQSGESYDTLMRGFPSPEQLDELGHRAQDAHAKRGMPIVYQPVGSAPDGQRSFGRDFLVAVVGQPMERVVCATTNYAEAMVQAPGPDERFYVKPPVGKELLPMNSAQKAYGEQLLANPAFAREADAFRLLWQISKDTLRSQDGRIICGSLRDILVNPSFSLPARQFFTSQHRQMLEAKLEANLLERNGEIEVALGRPLPPSVTEEFILNITTYDSNRHFPHTDEILAAEEELRDV
jgi:hypothetical protein